MNTRGILNEIFRGYALPLEGEHGVAHWARVLENGLRLVPLTGADPAVVTLFALFHDSRRVNENRDSGHGRRGAELAAALRGRLFELDDEAFALLHDACVRHTDGLTEAEPTVQTCWDADRLDLGRIGIRPRAQRLCTAAARDPQVLAWANERAEKGYVPDRVRDEWGLGC